MEGHIRELGMEVLRLRHEVNTILSSQQSFKTALGHLRQYLEERGSLRAANQVNERNSDQEDDGEESELEVQESDRLQRPQVARSKNGLH
jgi:hypothetical protein